MLIYRIIYVIYTCRVQIYLQWMQPLFYFVVDAPLLFPTELSVVVSSPLNCTGFCNLVMFPPYPSLVSQQWPPCSPQISNTIVLEWGKKTKTNAKKGNLFSTHISKSKQNIAFIADANFTVIVHPIIHPLLQAFCSSSNAFQPGLQSSLPGAKSLPAFFSDF